MVAFAPHLYFAQFYPDTIPEQRKAGLEMGLNMLEKSDELWVMGKIHSEGMRGEINFAKEHNIPVFYVPKPLEIKSYPISIDGNELLSERDCIEESHNRNYESRLVVLSYSSLKPEYRMPRNQIWYASHGPGCGPGAKFSDTVHLYHPIDEDRMAVSRREILGEIRPEVLEMLQQLYPGLQMNRGILETEGPEL
ncbi:DUF4406 domain-containing protein [Hungatella hathewayi]|uniref:DUF7768 domain-containing protein n=1 Tax=Hungatella hathewayi TaxID=154046 RepID=A0AAW9WEP8_9FIRM|nr:DUF4406 domain-containing protein [Hungatella hathewayi]MBS6759267.1 hypothetical protein [Hungatella hathewayi]MUB62888.1 hypothetical protein [Hungatella hathewayi]